MGWMRVISNQATWEFVQTLDVGNLSALEISGNRWRTMNFMSYKSLFMDQLDICVSSNNEKFDIIIAEQVWEHLKYPYRAGKHVFQMLNDGGWFILTTPFLIRKHEDPIDCTRWTAEGLYYFLNELGFAESSIKTDEWGNLNAVIGNLTQWASFDPSHNSVHSLENDTNFPVCVWGFAQKH